MSEQTLWSRAMGSATNRKRAWGIDPLILCLLGVASLATSDMAHHITVIVETVILVVFLSGVMGITRIPPPKGIPIWLYPMASGLVSGFMDSFIVLLMLSKLSFEGTREHKLKFLIYNMAAALVGGLITYFGEVYELPLALSYGMRDWWSMLPIVPPVLLFLSFLCWLSRDLKIQVSPGDEKVDPQNYLEFAAFIALLLVVKNPMICLGVLFVYSFLTGQGEDLIHTMKSETEMGVMMLLVTAALVAEPIGPFIGKFEGWWAFIPSTINGPFTGAVFPVSGDFWQDTHILSTAVQFTPISSLVGVMIFKKAKDWLFYMKYAIPIAIIWFAICGAWIYGPWKVIENPFYDFFGKRPELVEVVHEGGHEDTEQNH